MDILKFSERYFEIPIRMYQADEIERLTEEKRIAGSTGPIDPDYVIGTVNICPYDIMEWYDAFSRPRTLDDVRDGGFDCTRLIMKSGEYYDCVWSKKKFEARVNKFIEKIEESDPKTVVLALDTGKEEDLKI